MDIKAFMARWDNGAGWFDFARAGDRKVADGEVRSGGGYEAFVADYRRLGARDQEAVRAAITDRLAQDRFISQLDPQFMGFLRQLDVGTPWLLGLLRSGAGDLRLSAGEVEQGGSAAFGQQVRGMTSQQRALLGERLELDVLTSPLGQELTREFPELLRQDNFGAARFTTRAEQQRADKVKDFLRDKLGIDPYGVEGGFGVEQLARFTFGVPATPVEQLVVELRAALAGGQRLGVLQFADFMDAHYPRLPQLTPSQLRRGLDQDPARFVGQQVDLSGYARHVATKRTSELVYTYTYDLSEGKLVWKWVSTPVITTLHDFYDDAQHGGPAIRVSDRDRASSFFSVGIGDSFGFSLASAQEQQLENRRYTARGTIRRADGGYQLSLRDLTTQ